MKSISLFGLIALMCVSTLANAQSVTTISPSFSGSGGISIHPDGYLLVADYGDALPNANGTQIRKLQYDGALSLFASGLQGASGNTFAPDGNLYQSNIVGDYISRITPTGTVTTFVSTGISSPVGIVSDDQGTLYVANCGDNTIRRVTSTGVSTQYASDPLFQCPNGITMDQQGFVYVSNFNDGNVLKVDQSGNVSVFANIPGGNNGHLTYSPVHDALFVTSHGSSSIYLVTMNGNVHTLAGAGWRGNMDGPAANATFSRPNSIAVSESGDTVFVNSSIPTSNQGLPLNPSVVRMITGVNLFSALNPQFEDQDITIYPNPSSDHVYARIQSRGAGRLDIRLEDAMGKQTNLLASKELNEGLNEVRLDLPSELVPGVYFLFMEAENTSLRKRIIVN